MKKLFTDIAKFLEKNQDGFSVCNLSITTAKAVSPIGESFDLASSRKEYWIDCDVEQGILNLLHQRFCTVEYLKFGGVDGVLFKATSYESFNGRERWIEFQKIEVTSLI
jgi:hypothetical protein